MKSTLPEERNPSRPLDYTLGDLTVCVGTAQVLRAGREIPLPRLSFDLLLALVRAAPDLVTIDQLMNQVWSGVVVNSETVSQRIKLLRTALGDDARDPKYVAGVRGRGYRIIAPVRTIDSAAPTPETSLPAVTQRKRSQFLWPGIGILCVLVAAIAVWTRQTPDLPAQDLPKSTVAVLPFQNTDNTPQDAALAFGVAEALLHRLASSRDLTVIARTSSFTFASGGDARDIGRKLNARYLVEGSLQSDAKRLRITAQLIDAANGRHVWSMQFDRKPEDIFAVQDEIANQLTEAMQLTLSGASAKGGTKNFDAYLAYSQGRSRLASSKVADAQLAVGDLERAIRIDPQFADAHVTLARALMFLAERDVTEERRTNVEAAQLRSRQLIDRALQLDANNAEAYFEQSLLFDDTSLAEAAVRKGLELNPNGAVGYSLLYDVLWQTPRKLEAIAALEHARQLDPLEVSYDTKMIRPLLYFTGDMRGVEELSRKVLARNPASFEALMYLGESYVCCRGEFARGAEYLEQVLRSEPSSEWTRRLLIHAYTDMGDPEEAEAVATSAPHSVSARKLAILVYRRDWLQAGELVYQGMERETHEVVDAYFIALAVERHAQETGDFDRARRFLEKYSGISWGADGSLQRLEPFATDFKFAVPLASVLIRQGHRDRAVNLLQATVVKIEDEARMRGRGEFWHYPARALALALLGRDDEALTVLEKMTDKAGTGLFRCNLWLLESWPEFERIRSQPRFQAIVARVHQNSVEQREQLEKLRAADVIPHRARPKSPK